MSGLLGKAAPAADTNTTVYTVPSGMVSTANVAVVNRGAEDATVRIALTTVTTPGDADYIEYGATVPAGGGVLERTGIVLSAGEKVMVRDDTGFCAYRVHGFEETALTAVSQSKEDAVLTITAQRTAAVAAIAAALAEAGNTVRGLTPETYFFHQS